MKSVVFSLLACVTILQLSGCTGGERSDTTILPKPISVPVDNTVTVDHFLEYINMQPALGVGEYTLVAATPTIGQSGDYSLAITYDSGQTDTISGSWTASGGKDPLSANNVRHPITLQSPGGLSVQLTSTVDNYLYLLRNDNVIAEDDDSAGDGDAMLVFERSKIDSAAYASAYYKAADPLNERTTFADWKRVNGFDQGTDFETTFRDFVDLGYGRDMYARTRDDGGIAIYVDNYLVQIGEGDASSYGPLGLDAALEANRRFLIGSNTIEFSPVDPSDPTSEKIVKVFAYSPEGADGVQPRILSLDFDGRGEKFLPTVCMVCHGGDLYALEADGSFPQQTLTSMKLNILDPEAFTFSNQSGFTEAESEAPIKGMNKMVHDTFVAMNARDATNAGKWSGDLAIDLAAGAYGDDFSADTYDREYIPLGWRQTDDRPAGVESLYRDVVKVHCIACHALKGTSTGEARLTTVGDKRIPLANAINFSSFEKFISYNDQIIEQVYRRAQMPTSLLSYEKFWSNPAGIPTQLAGFLEGFDVFDSNGVIAEPQKPVAILGSSRPATSPVQLNAAASFLKETYAWRIVSAPDGATASLSSASSVTTQLTTDISGDYVIDLTASNKTGLSDTQQTTITIDPLLNPAPAQLTFAAHIQPILQTRCAGCHRDGGFFDGIAMDFNLSNPSLYKDVIDRINLKDPDSSLILTKAVRVQHGGGAALLRSGAETDRLTILNWIINGAPCGDDPLICVR
jgi:mono/diheme cytochrome c family protein